MHMRGWTGGYTRAVVCAAFVFLALVVLTLFFTPAQVFASVASDPEKARFDDQITSKVQSRVQTDLNRYCPDGCSLLGIEVDSREVFDTARVTLGFDSADATPRKFEALRADVEILVDNRLGATNIERLLDVLTKAARGYGLPIELQLTRTTFPDSPQVIRSETESKSLALGRVKGEIEQVVSNFCPDDCRLNSVEVKTSRMAVEESQTQPSHRVVVVPESKWALMIQGASVNLSVDDSMSLSRKSQIEAVVRDVLNSFGTAQLVVKSTQLPKSARLIEKDDNDLRSDPWGIDKLGKALKVFREFANTKEIIKEREVSSREMNREAVSERKTSTNEKIDKTRESEKSSLTESESLSTTKDENGLASFWTQERTLLLAGALCVILVIAALGLRFVLTGKQVQHLISEGRGVLTDESMPSVSEDPALFHGNSGRSLATGQADSGGGVRGQRGAAGYAMPVAAGLPVLSDEVARTLNIQSLRDEVTQYFIAQPKISREVFARILREDGVEYAAKCVSVLGEMVVFDLAGDHDLKKEVTLLAEYIHVSPPFVSVSEQLDVLQSLKLKLTAGKIRQLTQKTQDVFDFLRAHSARAIYNLIVDETPRSQAVVMTQLSTEKRRSVFEMFHGQSKSDLLRALGVSESLSRDYLQNVADVLKRKIKSTNIADSGLLGGADVILDLMEQSDRGTQALMLAELDINEPELSRQVRGRLVSIETLGYLSDGLLLEIFLSMESQPMVVFLAGVREHIRHMILQKAPDDIASDWNVSASNLKGIDPENYRLAEMQVLGKMRTFVSSGLLNLAEINGIMFPRNEGASSQAPEEMSLRRFNISSPVVA